MVNMVKKIVIVIVVLLLVFFSSISFVDASSAAICRVPVYDGICCSTFSSDYIWPSGNGICCGGMPFYGELFCPTILSYPIITVVSPQNTSYTTSDIWMNITTDKPVNSCVYSLDSHLNVSMAYTVPMWYHLSTVPDGFHDVVFFCKDASGNICSTNRTYFLVDTIPPTMTVSATPIRVVPSSSTVTFEVTCFDATSGCSMTIVATESYLGRINYLKGESSCVLHTAECEADTHTYTVRTKDVAGNQNTATGAFTVKKRDGCECIMSGECFQGPCIGLSICAPLVPPEIEFVLPDSKEQLVIPLGERSVLLLRVKNPLEIPDSIEVNVYGHPQKIEYWLYFVDEGSTVEQTDGKTIIVNLDSKSEVFIPIEIYAGKAGIYQLTAIAKPANHGLEVHNSTTVNIVAMKKENGVYSETPGLSLRAISAVFLFAVIILRKNCG